MNQLLMQAYQATNGRLELNAIRPYLSGPNHNIPMVSVQNGHEVVVQNGRTRHKPKFRQVPVQNALLRRYEWEQIDAAVLDIVRAPNVALNDFLRLGLTQSLDGIGVIISTYEQLGDMTEADVSMDGIVRGEQDRTPFIPQSIPVPIIHKDFQLSMRHIESSRRGSGQSLDVTQSQVAARRVQDKIDDIIFNGDTVSLAGNHIYGLTTKPERYQRAANHADIGGGDWGTSGNAYKTINGGINFLRSQGFYGPYGVYVATGQYGQAGALITNTALPELDTIMKIPGLSFMNPAHKLADGEVVIWQLSSDVADLAIAQSTTPVQWDSLGGFMVDFRIFTALTIRVKHEANGKCGVLHITGA